MARVCGISTYFLKKIARAAEFAARGSPKNYSPENGSFTSPILRPRMCFTSGSEPKYFLTSPMDKFGFFLIASASDSEAGFMYEFP